MRFVNTTKSTLCEKLTELKPLKAGKKKEVQERLKIFHLLNAFLGSITQTF